MLDKQIRAIAREVTLEAQQPVIERLDEVIALLKMLCWRVAAIRGASMTAEITEAAQAPVLYRLDQIVALLRFLAEKQGWQQGVRGYATGGNAPLQSEGAQ